MSRPSIALATRPATGRHRVSLIDPPEFEGTCPNRLCRAVLAVNTADQTPEHCRGGLSTAGRCPCSGWLARNIHQAPHFYREGVAWL